jgi:hypothetical protein
MKRGLPLPHAIRDAALFGVTLLAWQMDASVRSVGGLVPLLTASLAGLLTATCGYLFHEWGHLAAALASGSEVRPARSAREIFLFSFDVGRNEPRQFLAMSCGGFAASAIAVVFLWAVLPLSALAGKIALALVVLGVVATAVLELPPFFRVLRGGPLPRGVVYYGERRTAERSADHDA